MRKLITAATIVASLATLAVPTIASADVARYQNETATFTVTQPAGQVGQWGNVWTHDFTVNVNPCDNTFTGTGTQSGHDQNGEYTANETVTGKLGNGSITITSTRDKDGLVYTLDNAPVGNDAVTNATTNNPNVTWPIEMKVTKPVVTNTSSFKNHGDYVSSKGGGSDAAHACIGMPITH